MTIGPGHGRAPSNKRDRVGRAEVGRSMKGRRSPECYLIEPGGWQGRGLGGFLEEVASEMGTGGGVPQVRIWGKEQHSKQNPWS